MKQALSPAGRAALQRQLCSPYNFIDPDEEIIERMMQAKAVYFWEATAMELSYARELIRHGIEILSPEPGGSISRSRPFAWVGGRAVRCRNGELFLPVFYVRCSVL